MTTFVRWMNRAALAQKAECPCTTSDTAPSITHTGPTIHILFPIYTQASADTTSTNPLLIPESHTMVAEWVSGTGCN